MSFLTLVLKFGLLKRFVAVFQIELPGCSDCLLVGQQAGIFLSDHCVALAGAFFKTGSVEDGDTAPGITDQARPLKLQCSFCDALSSYAQHVGDQFLRHDQLVVL